MSLRPYMLVLLVIVVIVAVFGMPVLLASPMHHDMGCPLKSGHTALCATSILEHIKRWQNAFAGTLANVSLALTIALLLVRPLLFRIPEGRTVAAAVRKRQPERPTLFQELFSNGILNPKVF